MYYVLRKIAVIKPVSRYRSSGPRLKYWEGRLGSAQARAVDTFISRPSACGLVRSPPFESIDVDLDDNYHTQ